MAGPTLSNSWYRVAELKPRLRAHTRMHRHRYRGEIWYVLQDPVSGRIHRFSPAARLLIATMDGQRTVADLWALARRHLAENAPSQDEMIQLLGQLHAADLLLSNVTPDVAEIFERGQRQEKSRRRRSYTNPMALRIHLWDPQLFLVGIDGFLKWMWSRWGGLLWLAVVLPALVLVPPHWKELTNDLSDRILAADNLLLLWLIFPLVKILHELGHATATRVGGGEVHDLGIMLLVLMPVPYVDASASTVFRSKYRRALVGAAGMIVELFIAALAMYVWLLAEHGTVRGIAFNVMLVAGVSTLIFNGNPLLRYDAYYILSDLIEIPNLSQRALNYWKHVLERYAFAFHDGTAPATTRSEKAWFLFYGLASSVYRVVVTVSIALFIATKFFFVGVILAIWGVVAMAVVPLVKGIRYLLASNRAPRKRRRALAVTAGAVLALLAILFVIPAPFRTQAEGVVWLPEQRIVRAGGNGFLKELIVPSGTHVARGDVLMLAYEPAIDAQIRLGEGRVAELEATYAQQFVKDIAKAKVIREQLEGERAALDRARERARELIVMSGSTGIFVAPGAVDMPGRFYRKGELLGYVTDETRPLARVVVTQSDIDVVRLATDRVQVRLAHRPEEAIDAQVTRQVPAAEDILPSRALATEGGGKIALDPRDPKGGKTLERLFQFDIDLPDPIRINQFGERVHVRFDLQPEPLAFQWYRSVRRIFLTHFNV